MNLQLFGTRKCPDTRKAERWFKERGVRFQFVDLAEKGLSPGELRSLAQALGAGKLIDREGRRFRDRGFEHMDFDPEEEILADPLLLKTPIAREGRRATLGYAPETWAAWLAGS
jgi:arsenate reductase